MTEQLNTYACMVVPQTLVLPSPFNSKTSVCKIESPCQPLEDEELEKSSIHSPVPTYRPACRVCGAEQTLQTSRTSSLRQA